MGIPLQGCMCRHFCLVVLQSGSIKQLPGKCLWEKKKTQENTDYLCTFYAVSWQNGCDVWQDPPSREVLFCVSLCRFFLFLIFAPNTELTNSICAPGCVEQRATGEWTLWRVNVEHGGHLCSPSHSWATTHIFFFLTALQSQGPLQLSMPLCNAVERGESWNLLYDPPGKQSL